MAFEFTEPRNLAVFVCEHVARGARVARPILYVAHDPDGDWQFLCGEDHGEDAKPMLVGLGCVVDGDPTLNQLAGMGCHHVATRSGPDAAWDIVDEMEDHVRSNIRDHGWHVMMIPEDDDGPGFAYSIGLDPELVVIGLKIDLMHSMINELGRRMRDGAHVGAGDHVEGLLVGAACVMIDVDRARYSDYFGYALWYHRGPEFRALQIVWPGKANGTLPWEPGGEGLLAHQPLLGTPPPR